MSGILQLVNTFGPSGPFAVKNSLRLRSSASAYLSRTITLSATWTLSVWVKRGALGLTSPIFGSSVLFNSNDTLTAGTLTTTAVYRDPSAWYHIVVSNNGCYVNGVSVGSTATGILVSPLIGSNAINYFDGYLAELNLIDGQALTPSSFGAFDATSGVWQPTRYSGTYGANGFYLKFSDTTSTTTLCYDYSGNSNNWTPNNISLTAGSTYDSMLDSPTNYDNGGNGVGNYAVLNPLNMESGLTMYWANLYGYTASSWKCCTSTIAVTSGKWYWEVLYTAGSSYGMFGISNTAFDASAGGFWSKAGGYAYYSTGDKYIAGSTSSYGASYSGGDVIGFALDMDAGTLTCYKNNVSQGVLSSGISGAVVPAFAVYNGGFQPTFGQRPFAYTPPTGYKALNTQNLPAPSIQNGSNFMAATIYTANGGVQPISNAVNGITFQPDFVWIKSRSAAAGHTLFDSIRGAANYLVSNTTNPEASAPTYMTSFDSGGFSMGSGNDPNGRTMVGWQWKAGGTAGTNTAGSITSSVSANTTAGFSVVTYTGTGSAATVGHGLGIAPSMVIVKRRNSTGDWCVWHTSIYALYGASYFAFLNTTDAAFSSSTVFNGNTTSTTFPVVSNNATNASGGTYVAYCFAAIPGYSAFGSYTGNGSSDGPFVYCGVRPRFVLVKNVSAAGSWMIYDTSRDTYNTMPDILRPESSAAEQNNPSYAIDCVSNGFKIRSTGGDYNASGQNYVYAAFAENPLKYSLAR